MNVDVLQSGRSKRKKGLPEWGTRGHNPSSGNLSR